MSLNRPIWKVRDWIDIEKLDWNMLSLNPHIKAIEILEENPINKGLIALL